MLAWLVMSLTPSVTPIHAQETLTPPGLMLVILLDDSLTNTGDTNTLSYYSRGGNLSRRATDPNNYRADAAIDLLTHLQSDLTAFHQVAVLRFANNDSDMKWLSEQSAGQKFVTVGGVGNSDGYNQLVTAITGRLPIGTGRPGQLDNAIVAAQEVITLQYDQNRDTPLKPVVLLIADDVPIDDAIENSPINDVGEQLETAQNAWRAKLPLFEDPLSELVNLPSDGFRPYTGACAAQAGGVTFAVFAMGAANWFDADGTLADFDTVQESQATEYFPALAARLTSLDGLDGSPLAYPIDPKFADADSVQLRADLQSAVSRLHRALRCATPVTIERETNTPANQTEFNFRLSAFYQQVRVTVTIPSSGSSVTFTRPDGTVADDLQKFAVSYGETRREIYTLTRPTDVDSAPKWSEGVWKVNISEIETATVTAEADLNLDGLDYTEVGDFTDLTPGRSEDYRLTLEKDGVTLRNDPLVMGLNVSLRASNGNTTPLELALENGDYQWTVVGDKAPSSGTYYVEFGLDLTPRDGTLLTSTNAKRSLRQLPLEYVTGFEISQDDPRTGATWACDDGKYSQELSVITRQASTGSNPDSLGSFTRVEMYYPLPDFSQSPSPTPMAILSWKPDLDDNDDSIRFSELIDCNLFQTGGDQNLLVIARFPGAEGTPVALDLGFSLVTFTPSLTPTLVPSLTPTSALTPTPTPTPQPSGAQPMRDITTSVLSPPMIYILIASLATLGIPATLRQFRTIFVENLPLLSVEILPPDATQTEPILPLWKRLPPMRYIGLLQRRRITIKNQRGEREWVCTVRGGQNGQLLIVAGVIPIDVQGQVFQPNSSATTQRARTTIKYGEVDDQTGLTQNQHELIILNNNRGVL